MPHFNLDIFSRKFPVRKKFNLDLFIKLLNKLGSPHLRLPPTIFYDHMSYLGKSLSEIAYAKAGIFKTGTPAFSAVQFKEVTKTLVKCAKDLSIHFFLEGQDWNIQENQGKLIYNSNLTCTDISLKGKYQFQNASLALSIASFLQNIFKLNESHLKQGIASAIWKGRLQNMTPTFLMNYLVKGSEIWLDSAHNEGGARALIESVRTWKFLPTYFIVGMLNHKDPQGFLLILSELAQRFYFIPILTSEKHVLPEEFIRIISQKDGFIAHSVIDALQKITELSSTPVRVIICGSVYLGGDVLNMVKNQDETIS